jgi:hypothetical protein
MAFFIVTAVKTSNLTCKKVKISLFQAVEAPRVERGRGSHIT